MILMKYSRRQLILTSLIFLLPIAAGLLLWRTLPDAIAIHWGADGAADGFSSRAFAVFGLPLIMLGLHWLCVLASAKDPRYTHQHPQLLQVVLWICPVLSLVISGVIFSVARGAVFSPVLLIAPLLGLFFLVLGNLLPKCRRNTSLGIRVSWALSNDDNWNATHRLGGWVWVIGGLVLLGSMMLPEKIAMGVWVFTLAAMLLIPIVYSFLYYQKQVQRGEMPAKPASQLLPWQKHVGRIGTAVGIAVLVGAILLCVTGDVSVRFDESSFTVDATYWSELTVPYARIASAAYHEDCDAGSRLSGFGTPRLSLGLFQNEAFGQYTRYTYTACSACVVLTGESGQTLVINGADAAQTQALYQAFLTRIE